MEEQIAFALKMAETAGKPEQKKVIRKMGISEQTDKYGIKNYGGPELSEPRWWKQLEEEYRSLKRTIADLILDK